MQWEFRGFPERRGKMVSLALRGPQVPQDRPAHKGSRDYPSSSWMRLRTGRMALQGRKELMEQQDYKDLKVWLELGGQPSSSLEKRERTVSMDPQELGVLTAQLEELVERAHLVLQELRSSLRETQEKTAKTAYPGLRGQLALQARQDRRDLKAFRAWLSSCPERMEQKENVGSPVPQVQQVQQDLALAHSREITRPAHSPSPQGSLGFRDPSWSW